MLPQAKRNLEEALEKGIKGPNRECSYYPCHFPNQDCTFCYCPFYPCLDERLGKFKISSKGEKVWSCKNCDWIHTREVAEKALEELRKNYTSEESLKEIFRRLRDG